MKILGIDDNVDITELLSMTLGAMGHEFSFVNTGKDGIKLMTEQKYDAILLDLAMPDFSGLDVLKELETKGNLPDYNIILFTASSVSESEINEFLKKGVRGIIRKPIEVDELEKQIAKTSILSDKISLSTSFHSLVENQQVDLILKHLINSLSKKIEELEIAKNELELSQEQMITESKEHQQVRKLNLKLVDMYSDKITELEYLNNNLSDQVTKKIQDIIHVEKFSKIGEYSARLVHDLRNPLTVISNSVELLELKNQYDNKSSPELDRINRSLNRINALIQDTLDYVRDSKPIRKDMSIKSCFKNCIDFAEVNGNIKIKTPENDYVIQADPRKLEIVFGNLIKNSIESIGTENGEINVNYLDKENNLIVTIQDSGPDISNLEKLFEPLFSTKPRGTGLGLASCKNIIESHNGTISASNNPKKFVITFPLVN